MRRSGFDDDWTLLLLSTYIMDTHDLAIVNTVFLLWEIIWSGFRICLPLYPTHTSSSYTEYRYVIVDTKINHYPYHNWFIILYINSMYRMLKDILAMNTTNSGRQISPRGYIQ